VGAVTAVGHAVRPRPARLPRPPAGHRLPLSVVVAGGDLVALVLAMLIPFGRPAAPALTYATIAFVLLRVGATAQARIRLVVDDEIPTLVSRLAGALFFVVLLSGGGRAFESVLIKQFPLSVLLIMVGRVTAYGVVRHINVNGRAKRTLIVGAGAVGVEIADSLVRHPEYGMRAVGFVDDVNGADEPVRVLGSVHDLEEVIERYAIERVVVAFGFCREPDLVGVLRAAANCDVEVFVVPRFFELGTGPNGAQADSIWGIPIERLPAAAMSSRAWRVKRAFDAVAATGILLVTAPMFGLIALAVRLSSPGPVFFRQERIGVRGGSFQLLKFRSLRVNNDSDTTWSVSDDDRQTGIGRILRRSSLDELPQLINVIRGDMSLVGPRPERPHFVEEFSKSVRSYGDRHRVLAGMTGLAQVNGLRGDSSIEERARFDNQYIEQWSLWNDLVILARTIPAVIAYARRPGPPATASPAESAVQPHRKPPARAAHGSPAMVPAMFARAAGDGDGHLKHVR